MWMSQLNGGKTSLVSKQFLKALAYLSQLNQMPKELYFEKVDPYLNQVEQLSREGYSEKEMAAFFGVSERAWRGYKARHSALSAAVNSGRRKSQEEITNALYKRATGFKESIEELVAVRDAQNNIVRHDVKRVSKYFPPDMGAIRMWLNFRHPDKWGDKVLGKQEEVEKIKEIYSRRDKEKLTALETARVFEEFGISLPESLRLELMKETKETITTLESNSIRIVLPSELEETEEAQG